MQTRFVLLGLTLLLLACGPSAAERVFERCIQEAIEERRPSDEAFAECQQLQQEQQERDRNQEI